MLTDAAAFAKGDTIELPKRRRAIVTSVSGRRLKIRRVDNAGISYGIPETWVVATEEIRLVRRNALGDVPPN